MRNQLIELVTKNQLKTDVEPFKVGDTVAVGVKIVEGEKSRIQKFEGVVISQKGSGIQMNVTVRKISNGIGVERTFPVNSPNITEIKVTRKGKVRRAKLYYLRELSGKSARIKERI